MAKNPLKSTIFYFFSLVSIFFVGLSCYYTAVGYESMMGKIPAWILSFALSLILLFLNYLFFDNYVNRISVQKVLLGFLLVILITFMANFNALYSNFMKAELYQVELRDFQDALNKMNGKAVTGIQSSHGADSLSTKVLTLMNQLKIQIENPGNPGVGERAQVLIDQIETALGETLTEVTPSSNLSGLAFYQEWSNIYFQQINNILANKVQLESGTANTEIQKINDLYQNTSQALTDLLIHNPHDIGAFGRATAEVTSSAHNEIGSIAKGYLRGEGIDFSFEPLKSKYYGGKDLTMKDSFNSALRGDNPVAALISGTASLLLDLLVPLLMFLLINPKSENELLDERRTRKKYTPKNGPNVLS